MLLLSALLGCGRKGKSRCNWSKVMLLVSPALVFGGYQHPPRKETCLVTL